VRTVYRLDLQDEDDGESGMRNAAVCQSASRLRLTMPTAGYQWRAACWVGLPRVLQYSLLSISGCKFPFQVAVFLHSVDELLIFTWKLGASRFHFQLARLEIDLNICMLV